MTSPGNTFFQNALNALNELNDILTDAGYAVMLDKKAFNNNTGSGMIIGIVFDTMELEDVREQTNGDTYVSVLVRHEYADDVFLLTKLDEITSLIPYSLNQEAISCKLFSVENFWKSPSRDHQVCVLRYRIQV